MKKCCYICGDEFKDKDRVEFTGIADWHVIPSRVLLSISPLIDIYPDTLRHHVCPEGELDDFKV